MKKVALLLASYFLLISSSSFGQENIEQVFSSYFEESLNMNPELVTHLGITKDMGITRADGRLSDVSPEAIDKYLNLYRKYISSLNSFERSQLTDSERLASDILLWYLENQIEGEKYKYHDYIINPMFGTHNNLTSLMIERHIIESVSDAENYIARIKGFEVKFDQLLEGLKIREKKGIMPPKFIILTTEKVLSDFIRVKAKDNPLYTSLKKQLLKLDEIDTFQKIELYKHAQENIEKYVYPAYRKFITHLQKVQKKANNDAGVWKLPDGEEYYKYCLRYHTTTALSPKEVHKIGLKEVRRIQKQMMAIMETLGIQKTERFEDMMNRYWRITRAGRSERFYYSYSENARKQALDDYTKIIQDIEIELPKYFSLIPITPVEVKPIPEFKQTTSGPHYSRASLDGKHKGVFYANPGNYTFKPGMPTLTYHEAIPGHHFQFAIQQESSENRLFRNLFFFTGYVEGWALYAEKLGMENGWFEDSYTKLGYLSSELLRAVRLVLDTGLHYKKWSRDQAYGYMIENLGWGSYRSIDRYIIWPGQACAYKIGELKILELRKRTKKALKKQFDIKEFHKIILEHGSVPLDILEQLVDDYIAAKK